MERAGRCRCQPKNARVRFPLAPPDAGSGMPDSVELWVIGFRQHGVAARHVERRQPCRTAAGVDQGEQAGIGVRVHSHLRRMETDPHAAPIAGGVVNTRRDGARDMPTPVFARGEPLSRDVAAAATPVAVISLAGIAYQHHGVRDPAEAAHGTGEQPGEIPAETRRGAARARSSTPIRQGRRSPPTERVPDGRGLSEWIAAAEAALTGSGSDGEDAPLHARRALTDAPRGSARLLFQQPVDQPQPSPNRNSSPTSPGLCAAGNRGHRAAPACRHAQAPRSDPAAVRLRHPHGAFRPGPRTLRDLRKPEPPPVAGPRIRRSLDGRITGRQARHRIAMQRQ